MKFEPFGKLNEARLRKFETDLGLALPGDYRRFLLETNGGSANRARIWLADLERWVVIDCLFGLDLAPALDLRAWADEMEGEVPPEGLVIGSDPFGALLVLGCGGEGASGVYVYDHAHQIPGSGDEENAYFLAESWEAMDDAMNAMAKATAPGQFAMEGGDFQDRSSDSGTRLPTGAEAEDHAAEDQAFAQKDAENSYWVPGGIDQAKAAGKVSLQAVDRLQQARFTHQGAFAPG